MREKEKTIGLIIKKKTPRHPIPPRAIELPDSTYFFSVPHEKSESESELREEGGGGEGNGVSKYDGVEGDNE